MKVPTTPWSIATQDKVKINRQFLEEQGWVLNEEYPLFETFKHIRDSSLICSIGLYGSFSIAELHWINQTPEKQFSTMNANLTEEDYFTILRLLNVSATIR